jgi:hypothetical protein
MWIEVDTLVSKQGLKCCPLVLNDWLSQVDGNACQLDVPLHLAICFDCCIYMKRED